MIQNPHHKKTPVSLSQHLLLTTLTLTLTFTLTTSSSFQESKTPPPLPVLPIPTSQQLQWQLSSNNMALFFHFGPNTFTDSEWGSGRTDPSTFNPSKFDPTQWVSVAKESGFGRVILTAKHHDGFCLWPSEYTEYSVKSSSWKGGGGDVVKEVALAARDGGVGFGVYLSPWDRHEESYGKTLEYNEFYLGQLTELLTRYGDIKEVWLDGAKGEGEKNMEYFFDSWFSLIHQLQAGAVIFSDAGPDTRWVGDEYGTADSTCWSLFNRSNAKIGGTDPKYSRQGDPYGHDWVPPECDVSIRPGWFWHASESPKSAMELLDIYYKSVGRNCLLLLNVPPNSSGLISPEDIQVLKEFTDLRRSIFSNNIAVNALLNASSTRGGIGVSQFSPYNALKEGIHTYWAPEGNQLSWELYINLQEPVSFNVLQVQEPIHMGQRIIAFHILIMTEDGTWRNLSSGTTVGYQRLLRFPTVKAQYLKLVIDESRAEPLISYLGIYVDHFSIVSNEIGNGSISYFNNSQGHKLNTLYNSWLATM